MYVLDKLWRGDLTPSEKFVRQGSEYRDKQLRISQIADQITGELSQKGQELFQEYLNAQMELQNIEDQETFIEGFRMGAGLLLDVVTDYKGAFQYMGEE